MWKHIKKPIGIETRRNYGGMGSHSSNSELADGEQILGRSIVTNPVEKEYLSQLRNFFEELPVEDSWAGERAEEYGELSIDEVIELVRQHIADNAELDEVLRLKSYTTRSDRYLVKVGEPLD